MSWRLAHVVLLAATVIAVASPGVSEQDAATAYLAGTWVLNPAKSKVPKKVVLDPETLVIKCAGDSIEVATSSGGKQWLQMFIADGKEHTKDVGSGGQLYSKAQWKKSVLFTVVGSRVTGYSMGSFDVLTDKQRWSVSSDGLVLTREIEDPKKILVYDKQPVR